MIFSKEQYSKIKKLHDSVKDAASYGTTFLEIDSIDEISLSSIVKTIKDATDRFNDTLLEVTRGKVEKTDSRSGSAFIKFVIQVSDYRGTRQDWGDITVGVRYSSKKFREMMNVYLNEDKFIVAKFAQDISKKLKQYEGKTIYKNKTVPDSKSKDSKVKDDWEYDFLDKIHDIQVCVNVINDYVKRFRKTLDTQTMSRIVRYLNNLKGYSDEAISLGNDFSRK